MRRPSFPSITLSENRVDAVLGKMYACADAKKINNSSALIMPCADVQGWCRGGQRVYNLVRDRGIINIAVGYSGIYRLSTCLEPMVTLRQNGLR